MSPEKLSLIEYRISRAKETLDDALYLAEEERWNSVVNRLYYACFYMTVALLVKHDLPHKTHTGAKSQLNLHFAKTGLISKEMRIFYNRLFFERNTGDYDEFVYTDQQTAEELIASAKQYLTKIEKLIRADKP